MKKFLSVVLGICMAASVMTMPVCSHADTGVTYDTGSEVAYTCQIGSTSYKTLADAVSAANAGDTITMISDEVLESAVTLDKKVTIEGNGHIIRASVTGTDNMLVVNSDSSNYNMFINNAAGTVLQNMTIYGGKITAIVNNSTGKMDLYNVTISRTGNSATDVTQGGAVSNNGGKVFAKDCNFSQNVADFGAGFLNKNQGVFVLDQCAVTENRTVNGNRGGGAIENKGNSKLYLNNCTIANNQSYEIGGAINNNGNSWSQTELNAGSSIYMTNCTVTGNITTKDAKNGAGIGNNRGYVYAANTLLAYNFANVSTSATSVASDIGIPFIGASSYSGSSYQSDGKSTFFRNCAYEAVVNGTGVSTAFQEKNDVTISSTDKPKIFATLNSFGILKADGGQDTAYQTIEHAGIVLKNTFYAPIKPSTVATSGGTETYINMSDFDTLSNIIMAYKDSDGTLRSLGDSSYVIGDTTYTYNNDDAIDEAVASELKASHQVTTYQTGETRAKGIIGAAGTTSKSFYTIHAEVPSLTTSDGTTVDPGTVNGVTIYGTTVEEGNEVSLVAKANAGYQFNKGWTIKDADGNSYETFKITDKDGNVTYDNADVAQTVIPISYTTPSVISIGVTKNVYVTLTFSEYNSDTDNIKLNFDCITDSGYYSSARDSADSEKKGVISFNVNLPTYNTYVGKIDIFGVSLFKDDTTNVNVLKTIASANKNSFIAQEGWYHIIVTDVPSEYFDKKFIVVPFVRMDGVYYSNGGVNGDDISDESKRVGITTTVNSNTTGDDNHIKWLGEDTESTQSEETAVASVSDVEVSNSDTMVISFEDLISSEK